MSVYCVLGAKGQTGRLLVEKLVRKVGVKEVRCVVRDAERAPEVLFPPMKTKSMSSPEMLVSMTTKAYDVR